MTGRPALWDFPPMGKSPQGENIVIVKLARRSYPGLVSPAEYQQSSRFERDDIPEEWFGVL